MPDIFISYARDDRKRVARIAEVLKAAGFDVWWDNELRSGGEFAPQIEQALDAAQIAIVCWSANSVGKGEVKSRWVRAEAEHAAKTPNKLLPVLLEGEPPLGFGAIHAVDLRRWDPFNVSDHGLDALVKRVEEQLGVRTKALRRAHVGKRLRFGFDIAAFAGGVAGLVGLGFFLTTQASFLTPDETRLGVAALTGLAAAVGLFGAGAVTGAGYRGRGAWLRVGAGLALAAIAFSLPRWALPTLNPDNITMAALRSFEIRQTEGKDVAPEIIANADPGLIISLTLNHGAGGADAAAYIDGLVATLYVDRDVIQFEPNQWTEITRGGETGWLPSLGLIATPYRHDATRPTEVLFITDEIRWSDLVAKLKRPAANISLQVGVLVENEDRGVRCEAVLREAQDFIDERTRSGTLPNVLHFPCEDAR